MWWTSESVSRRPTWLGHVERVDTLDIEQRIDRLQTDLVVSTEHNPIPRP